MNEFCKLKQKECAFAFTVKGNMYCGRQYGENMIHHMMQKFVKCPKDKKRGK